MKIKLALLVPFFALLSGCATPLTASYTPSSLVQGHGNIHVEEFRYLPGERGKVSENQIKNTAIGQIKINQPVGGYVAHSFASEFKYAGYSLNESGNTLTGAIDEFTADDLGFSTDWTLKIQCRLTKQGKTLATKDILIQKKLQKFGEFTVAVNTIIKEAFEQLMSDERIKSLLR